MVTCQPCRDRASAAHDPASEPPTITACLDTDIRAPKSSRRFTIALAEAHDRAADRRHVSPAMSTLSSLSSGHQADR